MSKSDATSPSIKIRNRLMILLFFMCIAFLCLIIRIGWVQLIDGDWLGKDALSQQTRDIPIEAKRGTLFDRKGKELAVSIKKNTVWAKPSDIKDTKKTAQILAKILGEDEKEIFKKISKKGSNLVRVKRWIDDEQSDKIKKTKNLPGIWLAQDNKRTYPYGNFAAYVIGHVSDGNSGAAGIELQYDKDLRGLPGRAIMSTDVSGRETPYSSEKYHKPKDGAGIVLTIDEVIQHYAEEAVSKALQANNAKKAYAIVMDVKNGDILAMVSKPDYDPNNPTKAIYPLFEQEFAKYADNEKINGYFQMWRNPIVNDIYEPGSTFKLVVAAAALEEGLVTPEERFYDKGYIDVADRQLKCAIFPRGHGEETFTQAVENSCNPVFVQIGQRLGVDKLYEYIHGFGFKNTTGIDLPGEGKGIIYNKDQVGPVQLGTMSFGQSISVTPIQLITAISAVANDGKLMQPRIVKEFVDEKGNVKKRFNPVMQKQVISTETSKATRKMMESEVSQGSGKESYIPGYHVGGKTATAQKVINGKYVPGYYISSFVGVAPCDDPRIAILVSIDEPRGENHYGGAIAAPVVKEILYNTLRYLDIKPSYSENEKQSLVKEETIVPEVRNLKLEEAGKKLLENKLNFNLEANDGANGNEKVIDMFPKPGAKVPVESNVILYIKAEEGSSKSGKVVIPDLNGKTIKEVSNILQSLGLRLKSIGNGKVISQNPVANSSVDVNSIVTVEFK